MANIYVGFHEQRSSSRVLKPPGGGTSNIFGRDSIPDVVPQYTPKKEGKYRGSSIQDVICTEPSKNQNSSKIESTETVPDVTVEVTKTVENLKIEETKSEISEIDSNGDVKIVASNGTEEKSVDVEVKKRSSIGEILSQESILAKERVKGSPHQRVPPGGYSSGLW